MLRTVSRKCMGFTMVSTTVSSRTQELRRCPRRFLAKRGFGRHTLPSVLGFSPFGGRSCSAVWCSLPFGVQPWAPLTEFEKKAEGFEKHTIARWFGLGDGAPGVERTPHGRQPERRRAHQRQALGASHVNSFTRTALLFLFSSDGPVWEVSGRRRMRARVQGVNGAQFVAFARPTDRSGR